MPSNVEEYFARLARTYGDGEYYIRRRAAVVAAIASEIASAHRILDLGCGNGRYLREFRQSARDAFVIGADLSAEMLAETRIRVGSEPPLIRADASAIPLRDGALDLIFASHVLQFVADCDAVVSDLRRCLVPRGSLIATVGRIGIRSALRGFVSQEQLAQFERVAFPRTSAAVAVRLDEDRYRDAFDSAGLTLEVRDARFTITWSGVVEWIELRWMPFVDEPGRRDATRILGEIADSCASRTFDLTERLLIGRKPSR